MILIMYVKCIASYATILSRKTYIYSIMDSAYGFLGFIICIRVESVGCWTRST